ncbi:cell division protein FtsL [Granulicatella seriolae]|jgi:cell division protein FtsL|uniref:Cell division protein FtsL n=1 Tax=Granulicatella seriolae TaxID=2967226 RepID=A0ABT1WPJ1_9LACT|nr:cell division protein FtsL [Granulicatella seriolae]
MAQVDPYYRSLDSVSIPQVERETKTKEIVIPQEKVRFKYWRFFALSIILISVLATVTIVTQMMVANKNITLQNLKSDTTLLERDNSILIQSTQELSQYDRVMKIAQEQGLKMDEANVRNVTE